MVLSLHVAGVATAVDTTRRSDDLFVAARQRLGYTTIYKGSGETPDDRVRSGYYRVVKYSIVPYDRDACDRAADKNRVFE